MRTYDLNYKCSRTPHGELYFRTGTIGYEQGKPVKLAIAPTLDGQGWRVVLQAASYATPLFDDEEEGPRSLEEAFGLALSWYQTFKRDALISA